MNQGPVTDAERRHVTDFYMLMHHAVSTLASALRPNREAVDVTAIATSKTIGIALAMMKEAGVNKTTAEVVVMRTLAETYR